MSLQFEFAMHPLDEAAFVGSLLADSSLQLVNGPRWPSQRPELTRDLTPGIGNYVLIWPSDLVPPLTARHVPTVGDWYCASEASTLQLLRSRLDGDSLTAGRIALHDFPEDLPAVAGKRLTALFNKLLRLTKMTYTNSIVCWANPKVPYAPAENGRSANPSEADSRLWVAPHALRWLQESQDRVIRPLVGGVVEGRLASGAGPNNSFKPSPLRGPA